jgi:hypothetical protein
MNFLEDNAFCRASDRWVVKENRHCEASEDAEREFHRISLVTQKLATVFAERFNEYTERLGLGRFPQVSFMTCCFMRTAIPAPRMLFAERHIGGEFRKWNTNFGSIIRSSVSADAGQAREGPSQQSLTSTLQQQTQMHAIAEDEEETYEDAFEEVPPATPPPSAGVAGSTSSCTIEVDDVAQAFSHWTVAGLGNLERMKGPTGVFGDCLVCDIQGTFEASHNMFLLIDPVRPARVELAISLSRAPRRL